MRKLRSLDWFDSREYYSFARRSTLRAQGLTRAATEGKPVIGICNTASDLNPCNRHLTQVSEAVKRGVWAAGGFPCEFPVISLGEMFLKPSAMLYRNLMSMDVEEMIRANPLDAVVLLGGCDKTIPALLMGAASANVPAIVVPGGPMLSGTFRGKTLGSGTDGRKHFDLFRSGKLTDDDMEELECSIARSSGSCMVMGTASSMALVTEALGMSLPGAAAWPAVDSRRYAIAEQSGTRAVAMATHGPTPREVMTRPAFHNAITALMAAGASTNAVVHLLAIAGRLGIPLSLDDFESISTQSPLLLDLKPHGQYLMEDFAYAGGAETLLQNLLPLLEGDAQTVSGTSLRDQLASHNAHEQSVIRSIPNALDSDGGIKVLRGNLSPNGALIKTSAASEHLLTSRGRAIVFESKDEMLEKVNDESFQVEPDNVLVLRNAGPHGGPGFPEWGQIPLPKSLMLRGISDVVRISDARMSGTSYGTVVLHISPEAAIGGPLGADQNGDWIELNEPNRTIQLDL
ncbi:MAG: dihydroxy-acid dehydratase, partial [Acidobacteria bacterium]|nr:dihydroxy-acid dehydratase [Acidobacteriota bacterium]